MRLLTDKVNFMIFKDFPSFPGGSAVKNLPAMQKMPVWFLSQKDPLEKEMATHSSILAWGIPWTEEPGRLQSWGCKRVRHNLATKLQQAAPLHNDPRKFIPCGSSEYIRFIFFFQGTKFRFSAKRTETKWRLFCLLVWGFSSFGKLPLIEHQAYSEYCDVHNSSGKVLLLCSFIDEKTERLMV